MVIRGSSSIAEFCSHAASSVRLGNQTGHLRPDGVNSTGSVAGERNAIPTTCGAGAVGSKRRSGSRSSRALIATAAERQVRDDLARYIPVLVELAKHSRLDLEALVTRA